MKVTQTPVVLSLLLTLACAMPLTVQGEETPRKPTPATAPTPPPAPKTKPIRQTLTGRVVSVDRLHRTVTVQVDNLTYVLEITDSTKLLRRGDELTMADVVVGAEVSVNVVLRELPNGRVEVAVLSVNLAESAAAQGEAQPRGPRFTQPPPFQNGPNPGNVDGPVISKNN